jgi:pepF/M3 family oligoendopeptidase
MEDASRPAVRWDLSPVYASFDDPRYLAAKTEAKSLCRDLADRAASGPAGAGQGFAPWLRGILESFNAAEALAETLGAYCYASFTVDTRDQRATAELNEVEELKLPLAKAQAAFRLALRAHEAELKQALASDPGLAAYRFLLEEELFLASRQMSVELEELAADLSRSGAEAWGRLQESLSSNAGAVWDESTGERKTVVELRSLAYDPDRSLRQKAFKKEIECWKAVEIPMAAALNGVKGANVCLDARRGWANALERARHQSRISAETLDALISVLEESLPVFRAYLKAKARLLGLERCAFYDLFAPLGSSSRRYSWEEMRSIISARFASFDPAMGDFAQRAFDSAWIDAQPRPGKVGGAYCIDFPSIGESRILCNDEGSFYTLTTVAHELGHAYHHECIKDLPQLLKAYPMTLAETASIFAETIVFEAAIQEAPVPDRLPILEFLLRDGCQVIMDIMSRFYFERSVFEARAKRELSAEELCGMMLDAQRKSYGDALDPDGLHPYMWAAKGHYYYPGVSFYNYPYAFGQLFGLGLYARYREQGPSFAGAYRSLLRETGRASAEDVAALAGYDIRDKAFWRGGMAVFQERARQFEELAAKA